MFNLVRMIFWGWNFCLYFDAGSDAPDTKPAAEASVESAKISAELGRAQLAQGQAQYDKTTAVAQPVIDAQLATMKQTQQQGANYYDYMLQNGRPVQNQLMYEVMGYTPEEVQQIMGSQIAETASWKAKAQAAADLVNNVPDTYTTKYQDGAIKGSDIVGLINGKAATATATGNNNQYQSPILPQYQYQSPLLHQGRPDAVAGTKANPDAYYIKSADGSYTEVAGTKTKDERKLATVADESTYGTPSTPETDALKARLSMAASKRMADADTAERTNINNLSDNVATRIGETNNQVYNRYKDDIEAEAGQAAADTRNGLSSTMNIAARQGLRYGFSPEKMAAAAGATSIAGATNEAAAINGTRKTATDTMYGRGVSGASQVLTGATNKRAMGIQDKSIATAKKLDVAGLSMGLPGASTGAYGLSVNAGNSAVNNSTVAGNNLSANTTAANGTIMTGLGQQISGLNGVLNSQSGGDGGAAVGALGSVVGAGIAAF